jgi:hypothetical protein
MRQLLITVAALIAALTVPAATLAMHAPSDSVKRAAPVKSQVVQVVEPGGFDFRDAGIGAAVGALGLALVGGAVLVGRGNRGSHRLGTRSSA